MAEEYTPEFPITQLSHDVGPVDGETLPQRPGETLQALSIEHVLFTPAILYTHANLDRDPLVDFARQNQLSRSEAPFGVDCPYPLFQDLGPTVVNEAVVNWDHRIYAIARPRWEQLANFVRTIAITNTRAGFYAKIGSYTLKIVDPLVLHSGHVLNELPAVEVEIFMVSSNRGVFMINWAADPPRTRPYPMTHPPDPAVVAEGRAVLGTRMPGLIGKDASRAK